MPGKGWLAASVVVAAAAVASVVAGDAAFVLALAALGTHSVRGRWEQLVVAGDALAVARAEALAELV